MLKMKGPGLLGFQLPRPDGLPDIETARQRMINVLGLEPGLPALDATEKESLFLSLSLMLARAMYHRQRFSQITELLEQRRVQTGGIASFDMFSRYALFEASACLGAVRLGIDEIIFITARLRGITSNDINDRWKSHVVISASLSTRPDFNVPEIRALRIRQSWYSEMNDYRNVLFHRGWRHPHGAYFPVGATQIEALDPQINVMLMPDRASLHQQARPHQWTYGNGMRVEVVVNRAVSGFEELLDDVCMNIWGGIVPAEGTIPREQQPNVFVLMLQPALLRFGDNAILPIFTSETYARALDVFANNPNLELVVLTPTTFIVDKPAFAFFVRGTADDPNVAGPTGDFAIVLDPIALDASRLSITARAETRLSWAEVLATDGLEPISLPVEWVDAEQIFVWRRRPTP